jgi:hypothetical protein
MWYTMAVGPPVWEAVAGLLDPSLDNITTLHFFGNKNKKFKHW